MRIAVSSLAWDAAHDDAAFALLKNHGISDLEITPRHYSAAPDKLTRGEAEALRQRVAAAGLSIVAMHGLLYDRPDFQIFHGCENRADTAAYLLKMADLAAWLGADKLIFGAAANRRVPDNMGADQAMAIATEFFRELGEKMLVRGVTLCMAPNAKEYGCNFCVTAAETAGLVHTVGSDGFRLHLDAGVMLLNGEDPGEVVKAHGSLVAHCYASEPRLAPFNQAANEAHHRAFALALQNHQYGGRVTVAMLPPPDGLAAVAGCVDYAREIYGYTA
jgi:sugar phosphate isomerase/epimerase